MKKSIKDTDYTEVTVLTYNLLASRFGHFARITDIWRMLCFAYSIPEFEILNLQDPHIGEFESYLLDRVIDWNNEKPVDFEEIKDSILRFGDFTSTEKFLFDAGSFEDRLWAIFLVLSDPTLNIKPIDNND